MAVWLQSSFSSWNDSDFYRQILSFFFCLILEIVSEFGVGGFSFASAPHYDLLLTDSQRFCGILFFFFGGGDFWGVIYHLKFRLSSFFFWLDSCGTHSEEVKEANACAWRALRRLKEMQLDVFKRPQLLLDAGDALDARHSLKPGQQNLTRKRRKDGSERSNSSISSSSRRRRRRRKTGRNGSNRIISRWFLSAGLFRQLPDSPLERKSIIFFRL